MYSGHCTPHISYFQELHPLSEYCTYIAIYILYLWCSKLMSNLQYILCIVASILLLEITYLPSSHCLWISSHMSLRTYFICIWNSENYVTYCWLMRFLFFWDIFNDLCHSMNLSVSPKTSRCFLSSLLSDLLSS
jgi:hypothetical protein